MNAKNILNKLTAAVMTLVAMLAAALAMSGCVAENFLDCPPRLIIKTKLEMPGAAAPLLPEYGPQTRLAVERTPIEDWYSQIDNVTVYVFDQHYNFIKQWRGGVYTLNDTYEVPLDVLDLPDGFYNFVAWTNRGDLYDSNIAEPTPGTRAAEFEMNAKLPEIIDNLPTYEGDIEHRHYGKLENIHIVRNRNLVVHTLVVSPTTHRVNFDVKGLPAEADPWYQVKITDRNSSHDMQNSFISNRPEYRHLRTLTETPASENDDNENRGPYETRADEKTSLNISASLLLMQVQDETGTALEITNVRTDETVFRYDLVDLVSLVYSVYGRSPDFNNTREFDIELDLSSRLSILININGWTYRLNMTEL
ncbi:MAG: FimB/Mfa2 family fimbrial subunit [Alistipes sp.]|jgi:hypothetical protein|nr:FimB/Mfa2 family fimbrial subunit [Alistipes sp.]